MVTIKRLRLLPTFALVVALAAGLSLTQGTVGTPQFDAVRAFAEWAFIVGTWGHFGLWRVQQRRLRALREGAADVPLDDGTTVWLPAGWSHEVADHVVHGGTMMWERWSAVVVSPAGKRHEPEWPVPTFGIPRSEAGRMFPTRRAAQDAVLRELAVRVPLGRWSPAAPN